MKLKSRGQTTIEYMLMLIVVISLAVTLMKQIKIFVIGEAENCNENSPSLICTLERSYNFGNLRYYPLQL
jgi:hypothetical protein